MDPEKILTTLVQIYCQQKDLELEELHIIKKSQTEEKTA